MSDANITWLRNVAHSAANGGARLGPQEAMRLLEIVGECEQLKAECALLRTTPSSIFGEDEYP